MRVETVVYKGIKFRRYPDSKNPADRNYYRPHSGHIRRGVGALHCEIWKDAHGPIPEGHHIHHKDENPSNNDLDNLECMPAGDHLSMHMQGRSIDDMRATMDYARTFASEWHRSDEGRAWHRVHGRNTIAKRVAVSLQCQQCRNDFESIHKFARFCSNKCKAMARRRSKTDFVQRSCPVCKLEYSADRYARAQTCSRACGASLRKSRQAAGL